MRGISRHSVVLGVLAVALTGVIAGGLPSLAGSRAAPTEATPRTVQTSTKVVAPVTAADERKADRTPEVMPVAGTVETTIQIPGGGYSVAAGLGSLWVAGRDDGVVVRVDPHGGMVTGSAQLPSAVRHVAAGEGGVWAPDFHGNRVRRVDPVTLEVVASIDVGPSPQGIAIGFGSIWVANHHGASVSRIDPASNEVIATIPVGGQGIVNGGPHGVVIGEDAVWVGLPREHKVARINPTTLRVTTIAVRVEPCGQMTVSAGSVWVSTALCGQPNLGLARIDASTGKVTTIDAFPDPVIGLAPAADGVWYLAFNQLGRVNAATNQIVATMPYDGYVSSLEWASGRLWFVDDLNDLLVRVAPAV